MVGPRVPLESRERPKCGSGDNIQCLIIIFILCCFKRGISCAQKAPRTRKSLGPVVRTLLPFSVIAQATDQTPSMSDHIWIVIAGCWLRSWLYHNFWDFNDRAINFVVGVNYPVLSHRMMTMVMFGTCEAVIGNRSPAPLTP